MNNSIIIKRWCSYTGIPFVLLLLVSACIGDITQYKKLGDTEYYLVEGIDGGYVDLYYRNDGESVKFRGFAKDIFWNEEYIIVKCTNRESNKIINYCIIEQYGRNNTYAPWKVYEYATKKEFDAAKKEFGLDEGKMNYTDTNIPWSFH